MFQIILILFNIKSKYKYTVVVSSFGKRMGMVPFCHFRGDLCASACSSLTKILLFAASSFSKMEVCGGPHLTV